MHQQAHQVESQHQVVGILLDTNTESCRGSMGIASGALERRVEVSALPVQQHQFTRLVVAQRGRRMCAVQHLHAFDVGAGDFQRQIHWRQRPAGEYVALLSQHLEPRRATRLAWRCRDDGAESEITGGDGGGRKCLADGWNVRDAAGSDAIIISQNAADDRLRPFLFVEQEQAGAFVAP